MIKKTILVFILLVFAYTAYTQTVWGVKGGLSIGTQRWDNSQREALFSWSGDVFVENMAETGQLVIYGQLGYHNKGSAIVTNEYINPTNGITFPRRRLKNEFKNLALVLGAKSYNDLSEKMGWYYKMGLRLDYTLSAALLYSNVEQYVNNFNYGLSLGGGFIFPIMEGRAILFDVELNPDISRQIFVPPGVYFNSITNEPVNLSEQRVTNTTLEITLGFRFNK